jgi:hypothetical protein
MIFSRPGHLWIALVLMLQAGAFAQESTGSSSEGTGATSSGASSAFGSGSSAPPTSGGASLPENNPALYQPPTGAGAEIPSTTLPTSSAAGADLPTASKPAEAAPTTFSISTGYGRAPEVYVSGEGRLARPRFETRFSASIGFDDNVFQTPTKATGTPDTVIRQQITAGTEDQVVFIPVRDTRPQRIGVISPAPRGQQFRRVVIPGTDPEFQDIVIPGTPKPKRQVSAISRESLSFETQMATRRTVFTLDLNVNSDYYWNRPGKKAEYNGALAVRYLHRFTPRLQVSASVDASYLSQPDLSLINTPTNTGSGNYLVFSGKGDISYRWTPRFSTVGTLSYNQLSYEDKLRRGGDYQNAVVGLELRYLWSPRLTTVLEGRVSQFTYPESPTLDSLAYFGLIGFDYSLSRRGVVTLRVGEAMRTFDESGTKSSAPYLETSLSYQLSRASVLSWSNRFGFEEPPDPNTEILSFRSSVSLNHFFSPRLRGSLSINGIHRAITNDTAHTDSTEDTLDSSLSMLYTMTRKWSFNLAYTYTAFFSDPANADYFRDRLFAGFDYAF